MGEYLNQWRQKNMGLGLCLDCKRPAVLNQWGRPGRMCAKHRVEHREAVRARRWKKTGEPSDGIPLDLFANVAPKDLAYAAGLIDGEGWVAVTHYKGGAGFPIIKIGMTDIGPINEMHSLFGGGMSSSQPKRSNRKLVYTWQVSGKRACALAHALLPYLRISYKWDAAKLMVDIRDLIGVSNYWKTVRENEVNLA